MFSARGRAEIPVPALLDLYEAVEADRAERPRRYALAPAMERNRAAADRMRLAPSDDRDAEDPGHGRARARSLAYHQTLARRLRRSMADEARYVLFRWREHGHIDDRYADRWDELLARPLAEIKPGRDRDWEFAAEALRCALVDEDVLLSRVGDLPVAGEARAHIRGRLGAIVATLRSGAS